MSWNIMTVRSGDDIDDDTLCPVLGAVDSALVIDVDERDGQVQTVRAKGLTVFENTGRLEKRISVQDVKIDVYLTDSRIAIGCEKWDKGGGFIGFGGAGIAFALAANGVSKIRAERAHTARDLRSPRCSRKPLTTCPHPRPHRWMTNRQCHGQATGFNCLPISRDLKSVHLMPSGGVYVPLSPAVPRLTLPSLAACRPVR